MSPQSRPDTSAAEAIAAGRKWAYWVPAEPWKKTGKWVPSVIVEGVSGHTPMAGNGTCAQPWFWGYSYPEARDACTRVNAELGITLEDMVEILFSSLRAQRTEEQGRTP
jgi:hypothetical protein